MSPIRMRRLSSLLSEAALALNEAADAIEECERKIQTPCSDEWLKLSIRTIRALERKGIVCATDLTRVTREQLLSGKKNTLGIISMHEIDKMLSNCGLALCGEEVRDVL